MIQNLTGLTHDDIRRAAPSVFAEVPYERMSARYGQVRTIVMLDALREAGFVPTSVTQSKSRIEGKEAFTKHLLRLRRIHDLGYAKPEVHEVILTNSHDGTSSYVLDHGVYRQVCTNGLVVYKSNATLRIPHKGDIVGQVVEGSLTLVEESEEVMNGVAAMKGIALSQQEQLLLAEFALKARFDLDDEEEDGEGEPKKEVIYQPQDFLHTHRVQDVHNDLWTTLNTIQENAIKGGITRRDRKGKKHTTRAIKGIDQNVRINKLLWQFAERMMELKQA